MSEINRDEFKKDAGNEFSRLPVPLKVGRLTITEFLGYTERETVSRGKPIIRRNYKYLADCDCGTKGVIVDEDNIKKAMRSNSICSCGCYTLEQVRTIKHNPRNTIPKSKIVKPFKYLSNWPRPS